MYATLCLFSMGFVVTTGDEKYVHLCIPPAVLFNIYMTENVAFRSKSLKSSSILSTFSSFLECSILSLDS